jgi:hypothetical protein
MKTIETQTKIKRKVNHEEEDNDFDEQDLSSLWQVIKS